ncbi:MAG: response regulator transcription factor [Firmicutes bacterium]|nr:response regulator transcription factor [Bacillota bacterium]
MYKILIIEDDHTISSIMENKLKQWNYEIVSISDFKNILSEFTAFQPHLVLMDINLPYYDGFYWCAKIRQLSSVPIIFISSRDTDSDKIRAIAQGGDDYLEKPFSMDLLIAKVQAVLRRTYSYSDHTLNILQYQDLILDLERLQVHCSNRSIEVTPTESRILALLIRNQDKVVSRIRFMRVLWDDERFVDDNTLTVNVNRLRRKLESIGLKNYIKTIKGEGYSL